MPAIIGRDQGNRFFTSQASDGRVRVVFFGYTFCPDICPGAMNVIAEAYEDLPDLQDRIQVLFVTVDPKRDTPSRLSTYMSTFHEDFEGVRPVDKEQLAEMADGYGLFLESHQDGAEDASYLVDHSVRTFILDGEGRLTLTYGSDMQATDLARDLKSLLRD